MVYDFFSKLCLHLKREVEPGERGMRREKVFFSLLFSKNSSDDEYSSLGSEMISENFFLNYRESFWIRREFDFCEEKVSVSLLSNNSKLNGVCGDGSAQFFVCASDSALL